MRILIVEDEPRLQRNLAKALREAGYAVDTASDGVEGAFKAGDYDYDAIVLDVMLPKHGRLGGAGRVRAMKRTPLLMISAVAPAQLGRQHPMFLRKGSHGPQEGVYEQLA